MFLLDKPAEQNPNSSIHIALAEKPVYGFSLHPPASFWKNELPVNPNCKVLFHAFPVWITVLFSDFLRPKLLPQSKTVAGGCFWFENIFGFRFLLCCSTFRKHLHLLHCISLVFYILTIIFIKVINDICICLDNSVFLSFLISKI